jgi:enterochelin esterase family protein
VSSVATSTEPGGPIVDEHGVVFVLADRYRRLAAVRLEEDLGLGGVAFTRERSTGAAKWVLRIPRPPVDRMEYLLDIEDHNGHRATIIDPGNALRAPGAFGDKSVLEFADYVRPAWLDADASAGSEATLTIPAPALDGEINAAVWTPDALADDVAAPLIVVHDGPEFAALGGFVHYIATAIAARTIPPVRVALLDPGERNEWYSANPDYADTLVEKVLPQLPPASLRIGVGVSLGALALLHAHRFHGGAFDGLFLQSGSFFTADLDTQESAFSGFAAVTEFVETVHADPRDEHPVRTVVTCGVAEENLANNQRMAHTLSRLGYPTQLHPLRDAHNYTAWRDALDPYLGDLVRAVVTVRAS